MNALVQFILPGGIVRAQWFESLVNQTTQKALDTSAVTWRLGDAENILIEIGDFIIFLAAALLLIMLIWVGISYLVAGSDEAKATAAKTRFKYTIIGIAIIMGISVIIRTIGSIIATGSVNNPTWSLF